MVIEGFVARVSSVQHGLHASNLQLQAPRAPGTPIYLDTSTWDANLNLPDMATGLKGLNAPAELLVRSKTTKQ